MLKETEFCYKRDAVIPCDAQCRECEITDRYEGIIRNITEELNDWKGQACAAVQSNLKSLSSEIMKVENERDRYKNILIEIDAWLSFNTHPSKESIAAFKDDLRLKLGNKFEVVPPPKEERMTIRIPMDSEINQEAELYLSMHHAQEMHDAEVIGFTNGSPIRSIGYMCFVNGATWMRNEITGRGKTKLKPKGRINVPHEKGN